MLLLIVLLGIAYTTGFKANLVARREVGVVRSRISPQIAAQKLCKLYVATIQPPQNTGTNNNDENDNAFKQLIDNILSALPQVLDPKGWSPSINKAKLVNSPPKFVRAQTLSGWKRTHSKDKHKAYHDMDVAAEFGKRWNLYLDSYGSYQRNTVEHDKDNLFRLLEELDELELLDSLDEYMNRKDSVGAEAFLFEGLQQAFSPMKTELDMSHVINEPPRFFSPVKLSSLHKTLKNDKDYFKH
jgi:hypothetical protein